MVASNSLLVVLVRDVLDHQRGAPVLPRLELRQVDHILRLVLVRALRPPPPLPERLAAALLVGADGSPTTNCRRRRRGRAARRRRRRPPPTACSPPIRVCGPTNPCRRAHPRQRRVREGRRHLPEVGHPGHLPPPNPPPAMCIPSCIPGCGGNAPDAPGVAKFEQPNGVFAGASPSRRASAVEAAGRRVRAWSASPPAPPAPPAPRSRSRRALHRGELPQPRRIRCCAASTCTCACSEGWPIAENARRAPRRRIARRLARRLNLLLLMLLGGELRLHLRLHLRLELRAHEGVDLRLHLRLLQQRRVRVAARRRARRQHVGAARPPAGQQRAAADARELRQLRRRRAAGAAHRAGARRGGRRRRRGGCASAATGRRRWRGGCGPAAAHRRRGGRAVREGDVHRRGRRRQPEAGEVGAGPRLRPRAAPPTAAARPPTAARAHAAAAPSAAWSAARRRATPRRAALCGARAPHPAGRAEARLPSGSSSPAPTAAEFLRAAAAVSRVIDAARRSAGHSRGRRRRWFRRPRGRRGPRAHRAARREVPSAGRRSRRRDEAMNPLSAMRDMQYVGVPPASHAARHASSAEIFRARCVDPAAAPDRRAGPMPRGRRPLGVHRRRAGAPLLRTYSEKTLCALGEVRARARRASQQVLGERLGDALGKVGGARSLSHGSRSTQSRIVVSHTTWMAGRRGRRIRSSSGGPSFSSTVISSKVSRYDTLLVGARSASAVRRRARAPARRSVASAASTSRRRSLVTRCCTASSRHRLRILGDARRVGADDDAARGHRRRRSRGSRAIPSKSICFAARVPRVVVRAWTSTLPKTKRRRAARGGARRPRRELLGERARGARPTPSRVAHVAVAPVRVDLDVRVLHQPKQPDERVAKEQVLAGARRRRGAAPTASRRLAAAPPPRPRSRRAAARPAGASRRGPPAPPTAAAAAPPAGASAGSTPESVRRPPRGSRRRRPAAASPARRRRRRRRRRLFNCGPRLRRSPRPAALRRASAA